MGLHRYPCARMSAILFASVCLLPNLASAQGLAQGFPRLDGQFKIVDRTNQNYNCVAHTLGIHNQWIDPKTGSADAPLSFMDQIYGVHGYQRTTALNLQRDPRFQKIAVYATTGPKGGIKQVTHAALQERDGTWTSKLGHLPLIRHASPYAVDGPTYGVPVATYVRPIANAGANRNIAGIAGNSGNTANTGFRAGVGNAKLANHLKPNMQPINQASVNNRKSANLPAANFSNPQSPAQNHRPQGTVRTNIHGHNNVGSVPTLAAAFRHAGSIFVNIHGNNNTVTIDGSLASGSVQAGRIRTNFHGNNDVVRVAGSTSNTANASNRGSGAQHLGNPSVAGNTLAMLTANHDSARNTPTFGSPSHTGHAKFASNSSNNESTHRCGARNTNDRPTRPGELVGNRIRVNIHGNRNDVNINLGNAFARNATNTINSRAPLTGAAKNTGPGPQTRNGKNASNTLNSLTANPGNAKSTGNGRSPQANVNVTGNNKRPGALVGTSTSNPAKFPNTGLYPALRQVANLPEVKNGGGAILPTKKGPGNLVGNRSLANGKTTSAVKPAPLPNKNTPGNLVGSKPAPNALHNTSRAASPLNQAHVKTSPLAAKSPTLPSNAKTLAPKTASPMSVARHRSAPVNAALPTFVRQGPVTHLLQTGARPPQQNRPAIASMPMHFGAPANTRPAAGSISIARRR